MKIGAKYKKKRRCAFTRHLPKYVLNLLLLVEEFFLFACINELLNKDVCTGLWRFVHTDALYNASCASFSCEGCDCFLCHKLFSLLLNLTMKSHLVEVWVVFHTLKTLCCVLLVLGGNVP